VGLACFLLGRQHQVGLCVIFPAHCAEVFVVGAELAGVVASQLRPELENVDGVQTILVEESFNFQNL
jgi:hypothetical protein